MGATDYPDWTQLAHIVGCDVTVGIEIEAQAIDLDTNITGAEIMVPIDLQGAYIMMPVDIQAQYVTIDINIAGSDVTLNVAIQSSSVTLNVNISSQTGNLNVNLAASAVTLSVAIQSSAVTLNVAIQSSAVTLNVNLQSQPSFNLNVDIAEQSVTHIDVHLTTSTVTVNVNITSQSVTINVNLQSSSITLNVAIQSSAVTLNVSIVSSSATINVNLTSQSVNINMDIEAQSVGVYLKPDWETKEGNQKLLTVSGSNKGFGEYTSATYNVTAGKTLYITHFSIYGVANNAADGDKPHTMLGDLYNNTNSLYLYQMAGDTGAVIAFPTPIILAGGKQLRYGVQAMANHTVNVYAALGGYEI